MSKHRGRKIPWLSVVKFHKEIVARAEQGFFSLNGSDDQDTRWTSLSNFDPEDLAGPWQIDREILRSRQFLLTLEQDRHESVFIGGPCYLGYTKSSILLNAWARGRTVLFDSNNNKAVDVVRERVERFESEFPIAVRAGSKQKQNIQEVLRRTLSMASAEKISTSRDSLAKLKRRRKKLLDEQAMLQMGLDSHLPQRIDEARKTALNAYREYRSHLAKVEEIERLLRNEQTALGFQAQPLSKLEETLSETQNWINSIADFQELVRLDSQRRSDLQNDIISFEMHRNRAVEETSLKREVSRLRWMGWPFLEPAQKIAECS